MPRQACPPLDSAPQAAASAAASRSASAATMNASFPPHSATIGVRFSAQAAMTFFAVAAEPVNAILLTALRARQAPVSPAPVTSCSTGCSGTTSANEPTSPAPTAGVSSLGLNTTAFPAASAYSIEAMGVNTGEVH